MGGVDLEENGMRMASLVPGSRLLVCVCLLCCAHSVEPLTGKTITVKVYVDEEEPRNQHVWQQVLAQRVDQASKILSNYCEVRFAVTGFGTWQSDNLINDFGKSLREFETEVKPSEADISIGFSSQYKFDGGKSSLGGTRGPLRPHIFIRESSPTVQEIERLEVLVHELSHYLGAAHSGRTDSVMRPVLGDHQSRERSFRILLDPQNANIIRLISGEMVERRVKTMDELTLPTKIRLRNEYLQLSREFPRDPVARRYSLILDRSIRLAVAAEGRNLPIQARSSPAPRRNLPPSGSALPR